MISILEMILITIGVIAAGGAILYTIWSAIISLVEVIAGRLDTSQYDISVPAGKGDIE